MIIETTFNVELAQREFTASPFGFREGEIALTRCK